MTFLPPDKMRARRHRTPRTILALILREMSTTYGRTPGGYIWALLEPIGGIAMLTLILGFGLKIRVPALGTNFPLFLGTGLLPLTMFRVVSGKVQSSVNFSRPLLAYPGVTFMDAILARFLLNVLTQLMVFYIVMTGIITVFDTHATVTVPPIATSISLTAFLALGIGCLNCYLISVFPLWGSVWSILTTPLFLISGVFYIYEDLPQIGRDILWYNPLVHTIGMMRRGFYPTYDATYASAPYVLSIGLITMALGLMLLRRYHKDILNR